MEQWLHFEWHFVVWMLCGMGTSPVWCNFFWSFMVLTDPKYGIGVGPGTSMIVDCQLPRSCFDVLIAETFGHWHLMSQLTPCFNCPKIGVLQSEETIKFSAQTGQNYYNGFDVLQIVIEIMWNFSVYLLCFEDLSYIPQILFYGRHWRYDLVCTNTLKYQIVFI